MDRWKNKIAIVTGASAGIGASISAELIKSGVIVVGLARRREKLESFKNEVWYPENFYPFKCDVTKEEEILSVFRWVNEKFRGLHILVNNAGTIIPGMTIDANNTEILREVFDTNVMGLLWCTREAVQLMKKYSIDGHIIHMNSVSGHRPPPSAGLNVYFASKHAVTTLTETLRRELLAEQSKIRITSISPGIVKTELFEKMNMPNDIPHLQPIDVANAVLYTLGTSSHVQVHELIIKPLGEMV
uniref:Putative dehydrogenase n=1 Tax=Corethrella appendiculata TaxID=1370023 RepID=U5EYB8_9DIPT